MYKVIIPSLFMTALILWGPGLHFGHTYMFVIMALVVASCMTGNITLTAFGIYLACWFTFLLSAGLKGIIPTEIVVQGIDTILMMICGIIFYVAVKTSGGRRDTYMNGVCVLSLFLFFVGGLQKIIDGSFSATLGNQNFLGAWLAISLPFFFRSGWKKFIPVVLFGLYLSHTSTAIAAALIGTGWFLWGWKGAGISVLPACLYYLIFKLSDHTTSLGARWEYWTDALSKISTSWDKIVFGVGPGVYWRVGNELHNEYMYLIFNLGVVGLVLILYYIFSSSRKVGNNKYLYASFLAVCVNAVGNHVMHTAPTALLVLIILALKDRAEIEISCG